jgi:hypothetical protein
MGAFDPYWKWLGIPPAEQPPNLYRLLGVGMFESDPEVIANAADRQMVHVRSFQGGRYSELSQKLLNELAAARVCLLDPAKKAAYDEQLRSQLHVQPAANAAASRAAAPPAPPPPAVKTASGLPEPMASPRGTRGVAAGSVWGPSGPASIASSRRSRRSKRTRQVALVSLGVLLLAALGLLAVAASNPALFRHGNGSGQSNSQQAFEELDRPEPPAKRKPAQRVDGPRKPRPSGPPQPGANNGPKLDLPPLSPPVEKPGEQEPLQPPQPPAGKPSSPQPEDVKQARSQIAAELAEQIAKAVRPEDKLALARSLAAEGVKSIEQPARAYALLEMACDMAVELGEADEALLALEAIDRQFTVDLPALKAAALRQIAHKNITAARRKQLAPKLATVLEELLDAENLPAAEQLLAALQHNAAEALDAELRKDAQQRSQQFQRWKQQYHLIEQARTSLTQNPDDEQSHLMLGRHYCFVKDDWEQGLKHLARCADPLLQQLASAETGAPADPAEQLKLGDLWWEAAEKLPAEYRQQARRRAAHWYTRAKAHLPEQQQRLVNGRLEELSDEEGVEASAEGLECRIPPAKLALLKTYGGTEASQTAVTKALEWIVAHRNPSGGWSFVHTTARCRTHCTDPGTTDAPNAATALALLALQGAGNSQSGGPHRRSVTEGLNFLKGQASPAGKNAAYYYEPTAPQLPSHAWCTMALCEAARDPSTRKAATAAVWFIVNTQNSDGGWGARPPLGDKPGDASDTFFTAWNVMALRTAVWVKLFSAERDARQIERALKQAESFLDRVALADASGYRRSLDAAGRDEYATAGAMLSRVFLGWPQSHPDLAAYAAHRGKSGAGALGRYCLIWLDAQTLRELSGPLWLSWQADLRDRLIAAQSTDGHATGSWSSNTGDWGNKLGGRLFCTALATLTLEVYYRTPPVYK